MERLTIRTSKGAALKMEDHYPSDEAARAALMEKYCVAMNRLADYEDAIDMYADERRRLFPDEVDKIKEKVVSASFGLKDIERVAERAGRRQLANNARRAQDVIMELLPPKVAYGLNEQLSFDLPGLLMECQVNTLQQAFDMMDDDDKVNLVWNIAHFVTLNGVSKDCLHHMFRWLAEQAIRDTGNQMPKESSRRGLKVMKGGLEHDGE